MNTDDLVQSLARDLEPAVPLRRPVVRAGLWFAGAALYVAVLAVDMGFASGSAAGAGAMFWVVQVLAIAASVLASVAAFASVVQGPRRRWRAFAVAAAAASSVTLAVIAVVTVGAAACGRPLFSWRLARLDEHARQRARDGG